eukprot:scaffold20396_cov101-Isochrysis_galbana.AAC.8
MKSRGRIAKKTTIAARTTMARRGKADQAEAAIRPPISRTTGIGAVSDGVGEAGVAPSPARNPSVFLVFLTTHAAYLFEPSCPGPGAPCEPKNRKECREKGKELEGKGGQC